MAFSTKLNLSNSKFEQSGASELLFEGTNNFTGTVNLSGATQMTANGSTFLIDGLAFSTYTGDTTSAANGLTAVDGTVILGGALTGDTVVNTGSYAITMGNTSDSTGVTAVALNDVNAYGACSIAGGFNYCALGSV